MNNEPSQQDSLPNNQPSPHNMGSNIIQPPVVSPTEPTQPAAPTQPVIIQSTNNQSSPDDSSAPASSQAPTPLPNQTVTLSASAQPPIVSQPVFSSGAVSSDNKPKKHIVVKRLVPLLILLLIVVVGGVGYALYKNHNKNVTESGTVKTPYGTVSGTYSGPSEAAYTTIGNVQGRDNAGISLLNSLTNYYATNNALPTIDSSKTGNNAWGCSTIVKAAGKLSAYTGAVTSNCYIFNIQSSASIKSLQPGFYASSASQSSSIKVSPFPNDISNDALILEEGRVCDSNNSYHGTSNDTVLGTTPGTFALLTTQENQLHKYIWECSDSGS